jgi:DNA adenine methylase
MVYPSEGGCVKTPISYYGGKQQIAKTIVELISEHRMYCEPFMGGGAIFFANPPLT